MKYRILLNSASGAILLIVNVACGFVLSPIMVRELGNAGYGVWEILLGIVGYLGVLDLGAGPAIVRFVAVAHGRGQTDEVRRIVNSGFPFLVTVGLVAGLLLGIVAFNTAFFLNVQPSSVPYLTAVVMLVALNVALEFPASMFTAVLMGRQHHYILNGTRVVVTIVQSLGFYLILIRSGNAKLLGVASVLCAANLLQSVIIATFVLVTDEGLRASRQHFSWLVVKDLYTFGLKNMVLMMAQRLRQQAMPLVIGHVVGIAQVVFFAIPARLVAYGVNFAVAIGFPLTPYFAGVASRGEIEQVRRAWFQSTRALQLVMFGIALGIYALGESFLDRWMGRQYATEGRTVLRLFAVMVAFEALAPSSQRLLLALNRHGSAARIALTLAVLNVAVSIPAGRYWGIPGVAAAVLMTTALTAVLVMRVACGALNVSVWDHLRATAWRFTWPIGLGLVGFAFLRTYAWENGYDDIALRAVVGGGIYLVAAWFFALDTDERRQIAARIAGLAHR